MSTIKKKLNKVVEETFIPQKLEDIIGDRFGRYSKYIIQDRAIPDVRDGLKPVQRRIVFAMGKMGLTAKSNYKKSATVVGEVMGKYHPHGDSSIYDATVRLSQDWKVGVPLVEMHGNNGSIDGDTAAASRYTEVRMTRFSEYLLEDIDKNTVIFVDNFSEEEKEPTVLPAKFPNLLVNGAVGISSGYATNIPTHNFKEVVSATIALIDNPQLTTDELLEIMPGPDFPTGGIAQGKDGIRQAFETGAGAVVIKSKIDFEDIKGGAKRIVVNEIPFEVNKSKLVEKIDQIRIDKKVDGISEVRDESDREGLRIAVDLKPNANHEAILNYLLKNTDLQVRYNYNMVAICNRKPEKLGVIKILEYYITHQKEVVTNRTNHELNKAQTRLHIVDGLSKMVSILDEIIVTIRASDNRATSKENLIKKFDFTDAQAEAIVTMQLYRLSNTDILLLQEEKGSLEANILNLQKILKSEKQLLKVIKNELLQIVKTIDTPRKTQIEDAVEEIKIQETDLITEEQVMVSLSTDLYVKKMSLRSYNASLANNVKNGTKENDSVIFLKELSTLDTLLVFTNMGNYLFLPIYKINEFRFKDLGDHISSYIQLGANEKAVACFGISKFSPDYKLLFITKNGQIKQTLLSEFEVSRWTKSMKAMKVAAEDQLISVVMDKDPLEIIIASKDNSIIRYRASDVSLFGTSAGGVKGCTYRNGDHIIGAVYANINDHILLASDKGAVTKHKVGELTLSRRGRAVHPVYKILKDEEQTLTAISALTPNQHEEDVKVNVVYEKGNTDVTTKEFDKEDFSLFNEELGNVIHLLIEKPQTEDEKVDAEYLAEEESADIFNESRMPSDSFNEKPIRQKSAQSTEDLLGDLDAILSDATSITKTNNEDVTPSSDETSSVTKTNTEGVSLVIKTDEDDDSNLN